MSLFAPAQVLEGRGTAGTLGQVLADQWAVAAGPVLFAHDPELAHLAPTVRASLESAGYEVKAFTDLRPEPDLATADRIAAAARRRPFAAVVGLGGGSTLDMAKVAAVAAANPGPVEGFIGENRVARPTAMLALVPTTAGSGAEASRNAMLSIDGIKKQIRSVRIVPAIAVLDPELTVGLPPGVTAATGMDALSHAIESYMSTNHSPLTDVAALDAVRLVARHLRTAYARPGDIEARQGMLAAAYFGGLALNAGAVLGHSVAYTVASRTGLAHGVTTALALPYALAYNLGALERDDRLAALARALGVGPDAAAISVVEAAFDLLVRCDLPTSLRAVGIARADLTAMVDECVARFPRPNNPRALAPEPLAALYEHMFEGDPLGLARSA